MQKTAATLSETEALRRIGFISLKKPTKLTLYYISGKARGTITVYSKQVVENAVAVAYDQHKDELYIITYSNGKLGFSSWKMGLEGFASAVVAGGKVRGRFTIPEAHPVLFPLTRTGAQLTLTVTKNEVTASFTNNTYQRIGLTHIRIPTESQLVVDAIKEINTVYTIGQLLAVTALSLPPWNPPPAETVLTTVITKDIEELINTSPEVIASLPEAVMQAVNRMDYVNGELVFRNIKIADVLEILDDDTRRRVIYTWDAFKMRYLELLEKTTNTLIKDSELNKLLEKIGIRVEKTPIGHELRYGTKKSSVNWYGWWWDRYLFEPQGIEKTAITIIAETIADALSYDATVRVIKVGNPLTKTVLEVVFSDESKAPLKDAIFILLSKQRGCSVHTDEESTRVRCTLSTAAEIFKELRRQEKTLARLAVKQFGVRDLARTFATRYCGYPKKCGDAEVAVLSKLVEAVLISYTDKENLAPEALTDTDIEVLKQMKPNTLVNGKVSEAIATLIKTVTEIVRTYTNEK